jgi:hypothetical protein
LDSERLVDINASQSFLRLSRTKTSLAGDPPGQDPGNKNRPGSAAMIFPLFGSGIRQFRNISMILSDFYLQSRLSCYSRQRAYLLVIEKI